MVTDRGFRPNPFLVLTCSKATKQCTANEPKRIPKPIQCSCHANPQTSFATGQSGPGSATASVICSVGLPVELDILTAVCRERKGNQALVFQRLRGAHLAWLSSSKMTACADLDIVSGGLLTQTDVNIYHSLSTVKELPLTEHSPKITIFKMCDNLTCL